MHLSSQHRPGQVFARVILPLVLFVAMVGGIAWIIQYMPGPQRKGGEVTKGPEISLLEFLHKDVALWDAKDRSYVALWDPNDSSYHKEFERDKKGHFDFPFKNVFAGALDLGLLEANCTCTHVEVCLFSEDEWKQYQADKVRASFNGRSLPWKLLDKEEKKGIVVPEGAFGLARGNFNTNKDQPKLSLQFKLWFQPQDKALQRAAQKLVTPIVIVPPIMFHPPVANLGPISEKYPTHFIAWTSTRDSLKLTLDDKEADPCYQFDIQPLSPDDCRKLLQEEKMGFRIKAAARINATVHETKGGKYLDQGNFRHSVPLLLDGERTAAPIIQGFISGDVDIGGDKQGKIDLGQFASSQGKKKSVIISAAAKTTLDLEKFSPAFLKLKLVSQGIDGPRSSWRLDIEIPRDSNFYGTFGEDAAIILKNAQRRIRVPLTGTAGQG